MVLPLDTFLFCRVGRHHISTQQAWRSQAMLNVCFASFDVLFATCFYYEQQFPFHSFIRLLVTSTQHACWLWQTLTLTSASTRVSWSCHQAGQSSPMMMEPGPDCENASADHDWHRDIARNTDILPQLITGHPLTRCARAHCVTLSSLAHLF